MHHCTYRFQGLSRLSLRMACWHFLMAIFIGFYLVQTARCQTNTGSESAAEQLQFVEKLYHQNEFHRSISEAMRFKFRYPDSSAKEELDLYILKSYYRLEDFQSVTREGSSIIANASDRPQLHLNQVGLLLSAAALKLGNEKKAEETWNRYVRKNAEITFPGAATIDGRVDPERAAYLSGLIPGSGLLLSKHYGRAATSFLLNLLFIYGGYTAISQEQYGVAGLLIFFEISWYFGGKKASAEAARIYNRRMINRQQQTWLRGQFIENHLTDIRQETRPLTTVTTN